MSAKQTIKELRRFGTWEVPKKSITQGTQALEKHLRAMREKRRVAQLAATAANKKFTSVLEKELKTVGINTKRVGAVCLANCHQAEAEMRKYKKRNPPKSAADPRYSSYSIDRNARPLAPAPFNTFSVVRVPPYDAFLTSLPNPAPGPTSFFFANADFDGSMNYFLDTPITSPSPSNFDVGAAVGIAFNPTIDTVPSPFFGLASVQMSAGNSLFMTGNASTNFLGYSHSEGSVGWIVEEFDENNNFIGFVETTWVEQYYLDSNWGQTNRAVVSPPSFTAQTSFITVPVHSYIVLVWLWGNINAAGNQGWWASQAAGFGEMSVQSISLTWSPTLWPF